MSDDLFREEVRELNEIIERADSPSQFMSEITKHYDTADHQGKAAFMYALAGAYAAKVALS